MMNRFEKLIAGFDQQLKRLDEENRICLGQAAEVKQDRERAERLLKAAEYVRDNHAMEQWEPRANGEFEANAKILAAFCLRDSGT